MRVFLWTPLVFTIAISLLVRCASDEEKALSHLQKGITYFEQKQYKEAELELRNAIQRDHDMIDAHMLLGKTYLKLNNPQESFKSFARAAEIDPKNLEAHLNVATFFMLSRQIEDSQNRVNIILEHDPDHVQALMLQATIWEAQGDLQQAKTLYQRVITIDPKNVAAYLSAARIFMRERKATMAEEVLKNAIQANSDAAAPREMLSRVYARAGKDDLAEGVLIDLVENNPNEWRSYGTIGQFYSSRGLNNKAEEAFIKSTKIDLKNPDPYLMLAEFYERTDNPDKVLPTYETALSFNPEDIRILMSIAGYYFERKNFAKSEEYLIKVSEIRPNYFPKRLLSSKIEVARGNFSDALIALESITNEAPNLASAHYFKGLAHLGQNEIKAAKSDFSRTLEINPNAVKARILLAGIYLRERDADLALTECREIFRIAPDNYQAHLIQGDSELMLGQIEEAKKNYAKLIELDKTNPVGYYRIGKIHHFQREYEQAIEFYQKALSVNPKLMDVFTDLIRVYMVSGKTDHALSMCNKQLEVTKEAPQLSSVVHFLKGRIYSSQENLEMAEDAFEKAISLFPDYLPPYYALAGIYLRQDKQDDAITQYLAITEQTTQETRPHMMLGAIYEKQRKTDLAEQHYRKALEINPDFAPAANNLAYILVSQDRDITEALMLTKKAKEVLPEDPSVMDTLGWIYYKKGLYDSAIVEFSDSLKKLPDNPTIHYHLGAASFQKGEFTAAKTQLEKALSLDDKFEGAEEAREMLKTM